jgi:putative SOS response-associated peptidase YedK
MASLSSGHPKDTLAQDAKAGPVRCCLVETGPAGYICRMCNLYSMTRSREAILRLFRIADNRAGEIRPQSSIFPAYTAPVVRRAHDGERELVPMWWGFVLLQPGKAPRRVTNVRDDKVLTSKFWRPSFEQRRCLVPASSYCEPDSNKPAGWHWFALNGDVSRPLFAFPGIWQRWKGPVKKDGAAVDIETYSFLTTAPNDLTRSINHERMPVLFSCEAQFETWLSGSPSEAFALVNSFDPARMRIVQSGKDKEDLLGRMAVVEQSKF